MSSEEIKKVALVVGNSNYGSLGKLKNPANDAEDISEKLDGLGFKVLLLLDADLDTFEKGLVSFSNELKTDRNTTGFFYYAGHGVQANGMNYLIPVGQDIQAESFLRSKAVSMQEVLDLLNEANNKTNILVLDACRNNPFSWSRSTSRGLTVTGNQPGSSVIVYSTSENKVALDGTGRNGVFTTALLNHIEDETDFDSVINSTAQEVIKETNGDQHPAVYKQNFNKIFLGNEKAEDVPIN
ncbi:MAG: caspase family protein [Treponema sp.]|nr:caspase family protein [Treponema sp.]